jgi:hypothetical protein
MIRNRNKRRDSENRKGTKRKKRTKAEMVKKEGKSSREDLYRL